MSETSDQLPVNSEEAEVEELKTPSSLRDTGPLQGESLEIPKLEAPATLISQKTHPSSLCSDATRGIKPSRSSAASVLQSAAKKAARSNSRSDVHEYMRIRRSFV
ncbi:MAG: hypothetical protein ACYSTR_10535 [Planctomycetota bacterium]|jgi:hypothetical protein